MERLLAGKVAVVTGNSRGIGRGISLVLAAEGMNIVGNHVSGGEEAVTTAEKTRQAIEALEVRASVTRADIAQVLGRRTLLHAALKQYPQGVDWLFLNAAGGLGQTLAVAKAINVDAQLALVDEFLPHLRSRGGIVLLTSLWGQKHGEAEQWPLYESVAATKKIVENTLLARIPEFDEKGLRLLIVCGHVVPGTRAYAFFMSTDPELVAKLKLTAEGGEFPSTEDMGRAARDLILSDKPSGFVTYVGGSYVEPLVTERHTKLNKAEVAQRLYMYNDSKLRIDEYESGEKLGTSISRYTVRETDCQNLPEPAFDKIEPGDELKTGIYRRTTTLGETEGHFVIDGEKEPVYRGVDLIKFAAEAVMLKSKDLMPGSIKPVFVGGANYHFDAPAFPKNRLTFKPIITSFEDGTVVIGGCEISVGDTIIARINGIEGHIDEVLRDGNTELIEVAAQAVILTWLDKYPQAKGLPLFEEGGDYKFYRKISPGDTLTINASLSEGEAGAVIGNCILKVGENVVATVNGIKGNVLPGMDLAREYLFEERAVRKAESKAVLAAENI